MNKFQFDFIITKLDNAAKAVQIAQETLVRDVTDALSKLHMHQLDPHAHGIDDPDSYLRQMINQLIKSGIADSTNGLLIDSLISSGIISDRLDLDSSRNLASSKAIKQVYDYAKAVNNALSSLSTTVLSHTGDKNNPHSVNKEQVGLGNIPNAISDAVNSASSSQLATSKAVKTAYDTAVSANNNANTRVAKAGDTMTGNLTISKDNPGLYTTDSGLNTAIAPSADTYRNVLYARDKSNVGMLGLQVVYLKNKTTAARLYAQKTVGATNKYGILGVYIDVNGNAYTEAPAPAANDSSTKIATTSWVQSTIKTRMETDVVVATTKKAGMVKPDGTTIKVAADGTISVDKISVATTSAAGIVKPDNSTILIDANGVIRVNAVTSATGGAIVKRNDDGTITGSITGNAYWADLAEIYHSNEELQIGELVTIAKEGNGEICKARSGDFILGAVSKNPAVVLNLKEKGLENRYPIARIGIVEILVDGPVYKGDTIGVSSIPGIACARTIGWFAHAVETNNSNEPKLVRCII